MLSKNCLAADYRMPLYAGNGNIQNSDSHREYGQGTSIYFRNFIKT